MVKMTLRRNVITLLVWLSIVAIFTMHIIMTRRRDIAKMQTDKNIREINNKNVNIKVEYNDIKEEKGFIDSLKSFFEFPYGHVHYTTTRKTIIKNNKNADQITDKKIDLFKHKNADQISKVSNDVCDDSQNKLNKLKKEIELMKINNEKLEQSKKHFEDLSNSLTVKLRKRNEFSIPRLDQNIPWVFAITPTYSRYTQKADLIRLSQTLMLVTNLHWIIVEDATKKSDLVKILLQDSGLSFTHLNVRTPTEFQRKKKEKYNKHPRGVLQRNLVLQWIKDNVDLGKTPGVFYFMDDDNTYHRKLFDDMRWTRRVSVWPVALTGGLRWAGPILKDGKFIRFRTDWALDRVFPIDMAGFAINIKYWLEEKQHVRFNMTAKRGYMETNFLERMATIDEVEFLADNCTKILVWHTRTEVPKLHIKGEREFIKKEDKTNVPDMEI